MVPDIGHDLKNLLTPIVLGASHVQGELEECEAKLPHLDPEQARATLVQVAMSLDTRRPVEIPPRYRQAFADSAA